MLLLDISRRPLHRGVAGEQGALGSLERNHGGCRRCRDEPCLWFALHVIFGKVQSVGFGTDIPVFSSIDWRAALLSAAAMIAMLKLKIGMFPTLAGSALAGLVLLALPS